MIETKDATELAMLIRRRDLTALEAVDAAIERAEALQPRLNFMTEQTFDRARARAKTESLSGPFAGVPYLIKDMFDVVGSVTRYGSRFNDAAPAATSQGPMIDALERAGLVSIGRSALGELGLLPTTEPLAFGPTRNPWNLERSPGGSSGGSAAAVAAGVVHMADAADGGGSIRIPASACGLFGLKPSRGRLVGERRLAAGFEITVQHGLTRTVRDSATLFAATQREGADASLPPIGAVTGPASRRLRIGVLSQSMGGRKPEPEVQAGVEATVRLVEGLGHMVRQVDWPVDGAALFVDFLLLYKNVALDVVNTARLATGRTPDESLFEPLTLDMAALAEAAPEGALEATRTRLHKVAAAYDRWFGDIDVVLSPVLLTPPIVLGDITGDLSFEVVVERLGDYCDYTLLHNIAGAPAMSIPLHWTQNGLPVGMQFAARASDERTLFELAFELERAQPWAARKPPSFAG
jgi:amidase